MKKIIRCFSFLAVFFFTFALFAQGENPYSWSIKRLAPDQLEVRAVIPAQTYLYESETALSVPGAVILTAPKTIPHSDPYTQTVVNIYPAPEAVWLFTVSPDSHSLTAQLSYQGCSEGDNGVCYAPVEAVLTTGEAVQSKEIASAVDSDLLAFLETYQVIGKSSGYLSPDEFQSFLKGEYENNLFKDKSFWMVVLLVILGGLALNLTPCVLPMLPITLSIIGAGSAAGSKRSGFFRGGIYALGMTAAYSALGLAAVLFGAQFGTLNSSPWFNTVIGVLFVCLGLAMFDLFHIDFSRYSAKYDARGLSQGRLLGVFVLGAVTALLGGACVAPAVIATLIYTAENFASGNPFALIFPVLLGVGMALPWPFAGAGLSVLPKPGMWMMKVKMVMGGLIILLGCYYGWTAYTLFDVGGKGEGSPLAALRTGIANAERSGKPVLIDFWATWCKNCLQMDAVTFHDPAVKQALEGFEVIKFQAESFSDPEVKGVLDRLGVSGLPTCIILKK